MGQVGRVLYTAHSSVHGMSSMTFFYVEVLIAILARPLLESLPPELLFLSSEDYCAVQISVIMKLK